jgi:hypothetical protein
LSLTWTTVPTCIFLLPRVRNFRDIHGPNECRILLVPLSVFPGVGKKLTFNDYPVILTELHLLNVLADPFDGVVARALLVLTLLDIVPTIVGHNTEFNGRRATVRDIPILRVLYDSSSDLMSVQLHYFFSL